MRTRLISAAVMIPFLLLLAWALPKWMMAVVFGILSALAAYELLFATGLVKHVRLVAYSMVAAFLIVMWSYFGSLRAWGMVIVLLFLCALFAETMHNHVKVRFEKLGLCVIAGLLLPYLLAAIIRILGDRMGRFWIGIPMILAFIPDSGAYFAGRYFGKHKLSPVISPNKTVEGAVGGAVASLVVMLLYTFVLEVAFRLEGNYIYAVIYSLLGTGADVFGDLIFSAIKRQTGIKDYGNLIPGHGGILDRFDSMVLVAPVTEVLLILMPVVV